MYIIYNEHRHAYKTYDGWTTIESTDKGDVLVGLGNVMRFTAGEAEANRNTVGKGSRFVYFPLRRWRDYK
jgi:hypothetical protein